MAKILVVCSILASEMEKVAEELGLNNSIRYIPAALHTDLDKLKGALISSLDELKCTGDTSALIIGTKCHPEIRKIAENYGSRIIGGSNCIELLLGEEKMQELDSECNTFYMTGGWLRLWREIFCTGAMGWDPIDARINFGRYERILLLDTGLEEFSDEDIFEFFEFTQVPVETYPVTLDHFRKKIQEADYGI